MNKELQKLKDIKRLWMEFDPIGVYQLGSDWPDDEYDTYVVSTLHLLEQGASFDTLKNYISHVVHHDMGLEGIDDSFLDDFAKKLLSL